MIEKDTKKMVEITYSENNHIEDIIFDLRTCLGDLLLMELIDFFKMVMSMDKIKILMARRCVDLYLVLKKIIRFLYGDSVTEMGHTFSSSAFLCLRYMQHEDDEIVIIDDVILHGRTVAQLSEKLKVVGITKTDDIPVYGYIQNIEKTLCSKYAENRNLLNLYSKKTDGDWRVISSRVVDVFSISGQPYVSYLPYAELNADCDFSKKILEIVSEKTDLSELKQKIFNVETYILMTDSDEILELPDALKGVVKTGIVRIYYYSKINKIVIVPYVILKSVNMEELDTLFCAMKMSKMMKETYFDDILDVDNKEYFGMYVFILTTYITSKILGMKLVQNLGYDKVLWNEDIERLTFNFKIQENYNDLLNIFSSLEISDKTESVFEFVEGNDNFEDEQKINNVIKNFSKRENSLYVKEYLTCSGEIDEQRAKSQLPRLKGKPLGAFVNEKNLDLWGNIVNGVDLGWGTIHPTYYPLKKIIDSSIVAGEQQYACCDDMYIFLVAPIIEYEAYCRIMGRQCTVDEKKYIRDEILKKINGLEEVISPKKKEQILEKSFYDDFSKYYAQERRIYQKDSRLKDAMDEMNKYKMQEA